MKNKRAILVLTGLLILSLTTVIVYAGNKNQNDDNGKSAAATGKENYKDGCDVPENAQDAWVWIPPSGPIWLGAKCCASNMEYDEGVYYPNQCCNPPDFLPGPGVPGNHCECFANRGLQTPS